MFKVRHNFLSAPVNPGTLPRPRNSGFALVEAMVATSLLTLVVVVSTQAMLQTNRQAAAMRTMAAARAIVQRNIDTALTVAWDSTVEPPILALTPGTVYDDDGSPGNPLLSDGTVQIATAQDDATATGPVTGIITRTVSDVSTANPIATLRQITIRLDYTFGTRPYSLQMTTERAIDD